MSICIYSIIRLRHYVIISLYQYKKVKFITSIEQVVLPAIDRSLSDCIAGTPRHNGATKAGQAQGDLKKDVCRGMVAICITNDDFCIQNDEFCITNDELNAHM